MVLTPGTRLGAYEVTAAIGAGGMGEVYRARDTRLGREVALKVLPESFVSDPERVARFQREAKTLAALNHPNIGGIHGLEEASGVTALVMELVEGEDLSQRIARGALPIDEALPIARQIAEALEAPHDQGIVHRDLKPANIKVRPDGLVKVLDFGLAKVNSDGPATASVVTSPAMTSPAMTNVGTLLGTAAYMSPEQAKGRGADKRSDIWAFGCVLYEMLTARRAFEGEDVSETLASVLRSEPDWKALPAETPAVVRRLLQRCLAKNPKQRLRDIGDAALEIAAALSEEARETPADHRAVSAHVWMARLGWLAAAALGLLAAILAWRTLSAPSPVVAPAVRFTIAAPDRTSLLTGGAISPDGRSMAFTAHDDRGTMAIWVRPLEALEARVLAGTEARQLGPSLFWSPDSRFIGYAAADGNLKKVDVSGGPPQTIASLGAPPAQYRGAAWSRHGVIIFGVQGVGLRQVSDTGGAATPLTDIDGARETAHAWPSFLPDGRRFLYASIANKTDESAIYTGMLDSGSRSSTPQRLLLSASGAEFAPVTDSEIGHLLFLRGDTLMAHPFDASLGQLVDGEPIAVAENLRASGPRPFSAFATGVLVFGGVDARSISRLTWFDRRGKPLGEVGPPAQYGDVHLTPDESTLIVSRREADGYTSHLWVVGLQRQTWHRLNPGDQPDMAPAASRDGRVAFAYGLSNDVYVRAASGAAEAEVLWRSGTRKFPGDWSPDGRFIIFDDQRAPGNLDLFVLPLTGERKAIPFAATAAHESLAQFSPDGRWIAYGSNESGRREVYVRDFAPDRIPAVGSERITISSGGGDKVRWRPDGKEIYYIAAGGKMMAVPVRLAPAFEPGVPVPLFDTNVAGTYSYDVTTDGRFLINTRSEEELPSSSLMTVVMNWQAILKR